MTVGGAETVVGGAATVVGEAATVVGGAATVVGGAATVVGGEGTKPVRFCKPQTASTGGRAGSVWLASETGVALKAWAPGGTALAFVCPSKSAHGRHH